MIEENGTEGTEEYVDEYEDGPRANGDADEQVRVAVELIPGDDQAMPAVQGLDTELAAYTRKTEVLRPS